MPGSTSALLLWQAVSGAARGCRPCLLGQRGQGEAGRGSRAAAAAGKVPEPVDGDVLGTAGRWRWGGW